MHSQSMIFLVAGEPAALRELAARVESLKVPLTVCRSIDEALAAPMPVGPGCVVAELPRRTQDNLRWLERLGAAAGNSP